jgi:hypothetical protein
MTYCHWTKSLHSTQREFPKPGRPLKRDPRPHFIPRDRHEHERWENGEDVADYCERCGNPRMDHNNGACPK